MLRRKLIFLLSAILLISAVLVVHAQDFTPIEYSEALEGEITDPDTPLVYVFEGRAGDALYIEALSDRVDTYLYILDSDSNILVENDDYSDNDLNPFVEFVVPANGTYYIVVFGYETGSFTVQITVAEEGASQAPVSSGEGSQKGEVYSGEITDETYYVEIPIEIVREGDTIIIDAATTNGDLDPYLLLFYGDDIVAENDDRSKDDPFPYIEYANAQSGDYVLILTRYGFDQGKSSGEFEVTVQMSAGTQGIVNNDFGTDTQVDLAESGYPALDPHPTAEWTVLAYLGGDNNLEAGLLFDMDEFERAGGSTEDVRIIVLMDRSLDYDDSNDDWDDTRLYEMGADDSDDARFNYPPTIDTQPVANLGELDTSYAKNLLDFLVWGIQQYPAEHYAVILNDHGGAWTGIVTDDTTGLGILSIRDLREVFGAALQETGLDKFDILINDACLMSSVEYYAAISPFFDFAVSSPEVTLNPSFDMTLLTETLNDDPDINLGELGELLIDKYVQDMEDLSPDAAPVLGGAVTDLTRFESVVAAVEEFAGIVNANPAAYATLIGRVRTDTYTYSFFMPEDEFGPPTNIDLGDFMRNIVDNSDDRVLTNAAEDVLDAIDTARIYGTAGNQLESHTTFYNIYFPSRGSDFITAYFQLSPLEGWSEMLSNYYSSLSASGFRISGRSGTAAPVAAPSIPPSVTITNIFPLETSVAFPVTVAMEVVGRNISEGKFTVDQIQPDGTAVRLDIARIVTEVVENNVVNHINLWKPGVDDSTFTWDVTLPVVTDGVTTSYELVVYANGVTSLAGRYQYPGADEWIDVTVIFDSDGNTENVLSRQPGGSAFANVRLDTGGIFQTFRSVVTADGRVKLEPGTSFTWAEAGVSWHEAPAPSGEYNLGFLVEAFGGVTGFASASVTVKNDEVDPNYAGYVDLDWGFRFLYPTEWFDVSYFPDSKFLQTSDLDATEYMFVYPSEEESSDLESIGTEVLDRYSMTLVGDFASTTIAGLDALEFELTYTNDTGTFEGRGFAVYLEDLELGLVFSVETLDGRDLDSQYELLTSSLEFFDAAAVEAQDTGAWTSDLYTEETRYPVRTSWMPGFESGLWWFYTPDGDPDSTTFAAVTGLVETEDEAGVVLDDLLAESVEDKDDYELLGKEIYYGENHTWQLAYFSHSNGDIVGRMYVMVIGNTPYALWFEAPLDDAERFFRTVYEPMLDGFKVTLEG
jgi:hypothetical protein